MTVVKGRTRGVLPAACVVSVLLGGASAAVGAAGGAAAAAGGGTAGKGPQKGKTPGGKPGNMPGATGREREKKEFKEQEKTNGECRKRTAFSTVINKNEGSFWTI